MIPTTQDLRDWADHPAANRMVPVSPATLRSVADEIDALRKEKVRLNWLVSQEHQIWEVNGRYSVYRVIEAEPITGPHPSVAQAIDAAMAKEPRQ